MYQLNFLQPGERNVGTQGNEELLEGQRTRESGIEVS